ncbi:MAG: NAD(P)H-dependent glycerol-3-phosphate dehydrogenase [Holosporales bacterium]|nr:NAD(P)H-dependent glycerol-3-phosphate dehydrogenase [Holosporales bacterium]
MDIAIIGAGAYGTALAQVLSQKHKIRLYNDIASVVDEINEQHTNRQFLGDIKLDPGITASTDFSTIGLSKAVFIAVPAQAVRKVCTQIDSLISDKLPLISCSKGIEQATGLFMSELISQNFSNPVFVLSGPSFAAEISRNMPTAVNLAGQDLKGALALAEELSTKGFKVVPTENLIGVQICGAFKNVLAIVTGIIRGLNLGDGAESTVLAKGIREIATFIQKTTGHSDTILSLSGIGDIVMTCFNSVSRNHTLGLKIARNEVALPLDNVGLDQNPLAEGALTIKAWPQISRKYEKHCQIEADMPLFASVYALLYGRLSLSELVALAI